MKVSSEEFESINNVYNCSDDNIDKDKFCKVWALLNRNRIAIYKEAKKNRIRISECRCVMYDMINTLLTCPYELRHQTHLVTPLPSQKEALKFFDIDYENMNMNELLFSIQNALNSIK